jgi:hypothetical protein
LDPNTRILSQGARSLDTGRGAGLTQVGPIGRGARSSTIAPLPVWPLPRRFEGDKRLGHSFAYWRSLVREGVTERRPNATIASFTGHLLWHGVDPAVIMEFMLAWHRVRYQPPLWDEEIVHAVKSIERAHMRRENIAERN